MTEDKLSNSHYNEEDMNRRLLRYHTRNESIKGDLNLKDFFEMNGVESQVLDCRSSEEELINRMKIIFERNGQLNNYMVQDKKDLEVESKELQSKINSINEKHNEITKA